MPNNNNDAHRMENDAHRKENNGLYDRHHVSPHGSRLYIRETQFAYYWSYDTQGRISHKMLCAKSDDKLLIIMLNNQTAPIAEAGRQAHNTADATQTSLAVNQK